MSNETAVSTAPRSAATYVFKEGLVITFWCLTVMFVVMNTTMFNVALPQVAKDFGLSSTSASWVVTGYSIVFAISSITYSRLSDFLPIRNLLIVGLISLGAASLLGIFSHHYILLLIARLIQASGAASVPALGIVMVTRYIPEHRRGKSITTIISASSLAFGLGPVVGGTITQYLGWNYLFIVTGVVLLLIPIFLKLLPSEKAKKVSIDLLGACFIGMGSTGLLLFLTSHSLIALAAGIISLVLFWIRIRRVQDPFVQPALFQNKSYMTLIVMGFIPYVVNFASLFIMPMMLIRLFQLTSTQTGLIIFPGAILSMIASNWVGKIIDRYGNQLLIRYAHFLLLLGTALFALLGKDSYYAIMAIYMLISLSVSSLTSSVSNEISRILPYIYIGSGMGLSQLTQFFGGAFGVALTGSALIWQVSLSQQAAFSNIYWGLTILVSISMVCSFLYRPAQAS